jgi:hypothetical protein
MPSAINPWFEVIVVELIAQYGVGLRANVSEHRVVNRAGTELVFTTNATTKHGQRQACRVKTFFIRTDVTVGHTKSTPPRKHAHIQPDIIASVAPFGLVQLPMYHPIWNEPLDDFERLTFFPKLTRPVIMDESGMAVTFKLAEPPEHLRQSVLHYTSHGSTAVNPDEALLLKLGLQYCEPADAGI